MKLKGEQSEALRVVATLMQRVVTVEAKYAASEVLKRCTPATLLIDNSAGLIFATCMASELFLGAASSERSEKKLLLKCRAAPDWHSPLFLELVTCKQRI